MKINKSIYPMILAIMVVLMVLVLPISPALAFSDGPNNPGLGSNVDLNNGVSWQNPGEIVTPGSPYATATLTQGSLYSDYLQATGYGFAIPDDVAIMGIEVTVNHRVDDHNANIMDNELRLLKDGQVVGENRAIAVAWPVSFIMVTYGGPTDLWGTDWTAADINSPNFGVALAAYRANNGSNLRQAVVDSMQVTVYYGNTATTEVSCGDGTPVAYGDPTTCVVTVTNQAGDLTPTGTVDWGTDGSGIFEPGACTLEGADGVSSCQVSYTPTAVGTGTHLLTASYAGDEYFAPSSASQALEVILRPVTVTADEQFKVFGDPDPEFTFQITQGSLVFSDTFTGTLTRVTGEDAGQYEILQGSLALPADYRLTYIGAYLTIEKADAACTITPYDLSYDANPHTAEGFCLGLDGEPLAGLDLSGTTHTDVGIYEDDPWVFTDVTGNYNDQAGTVDDEITKRYITVTADALSKPYGQPDPELTYQVTAGSLLEGDEFSGALTRQPGERVGTYAILQGTLSLPDYYQLDYEEATFTITGSIFLFPMMLNSGG
jgi:hypothetical protein